MDAENAIIGADSAARFLDAAFNGRADIVGIGDSNMNHAGGGRAWGMGRALDGMLGIYATGVLPMMALGGHGFGYGWAVNGPAAAWNVTAPPSQLLQYALSPTHANGFPERAFVHLADSESHGGELTVQQTSGLSDLVHPWRYTDALRYHLRYGTFAAGAGSFRVEWRHGGTVYATSPAINPVTGAYSLQDLSLDVAGGARAAGGLSVSLGALFVDPVTQGPFFGLYNRLELPGRDRGVSYGTLLYQDGQTTRNAVISLKGTTQAAMTQYLDFATKLQGAAMGDRVLCVQINHGGNDRNDANASWNPATGNFDSGALSNTGGGFRNNTRGVIKYISDYWTGAGGSRGNLYFWIGPYHPQAGHVAKLEEFEAAAAALVDESENTTVIRGTRLVTPAEMSARLWYYNEAGGDTAHMSYAGNEGLSDLMVRALMHHYSARPRAATLLPLIQDAADNADNAATTSVEVRNAHTTTQGIATEAKEAAEATLAYVTARPPVRINARAS